jgi:hypothetical protein
LSEANEQLSKQARRESVIGDWPERCRLMFLDYLPRNADPMIVVVLDA